MNFLNKKILVKSIKYDIKEIIKIISFWGPFFLSLDIGSDKILNKYSGVVTAVVFFSIFC